MPSSASNICKCSLWLNSHCEVITRGSRKIPVKTLFGPFILKDSKFNVFTIQRAAILILLFKCISAIHHGRNQSRFLSHNNIPGLSSPRLGFILEVHQSTLGRHQLWYAVLLATESSNIKCEYKFNVPKPRSLHFSWELAFPHTTQPSH